MKERRCQKSGCLQMDLQGLVFTILSGQQDWGTESLRLQGCTWRLWWSHPTSPWGHHSCVPNLLQKPIQHLFSSLSNSHSYPCLLRMPPISLLSILVLTDPSRELPMSHSLSPFCELHPSHTGQHLPTTRLVSCVYTVQTCLCMELVFHPLLEP